MIEQNGMQQTDWLSLRLGLHYYEAKQTQGRADTTGHWTIQPALPSSLSQLCEQMVPKKG